MGRAGEKAQKSHAEGHVAAIDSPPKIDAGGVFWGGLVLVAKDVEVFVAGRVDGFDKFLRIFTRKRPGQEQIIGLKSAESIVEAKGLDFFEGLIVEGQFSSKDPHGVTRELFENFITLSASPRIFLAQDGVA